MKMGCRLVGLALWLLWSGSAQAHLLKVFVYADGDRLQGSSYFSGGAAAAQASIKIVDPNGATVAELISDADGEFSYRVPTITAYTVVADSGDGHRAEWRIEAAELGATSFDKNTDLSLELGVPSAITTDDPSISAIMATDDRFERLINQALARQVGPLRRELQQHNDQARLADIVGGIGFIFGLAGVLLWWRSRQ